MANLDVSGLKKFRRWLKQYEMSHGSQPPQHLMSSFLEGELEANIGRQQASRALSLQERQIDIGEEQFGKTFGEAQEQFGKTFGESQRQFDVQQERYGAEFGEQRRQFNVQSGQFEQQFAELQKQSAIKQQNWVTELGVSQKAADKLLEAERMGGYMKMGSLGIDIAGNWSELGTAGMDLLGGISSIGLTSWGAISSGWDAGADWLGSFFSTW